MSSRNPFSIRHVLVNRLSDYLLPTPVSVREKRLERWLDKLWLVQNRIMTLVLTSVAIVLAGVAWKVTYATGGTQGVYVHLGYLPILLTALFWRIWSTLLVAAGVTLLFGPLMPLDVAAQQPQETQAWLVRGAFFVGIGVFVSLGSLVMKELHRRREKEIFQDNVTGLPTKPYFRSAVFPLLDAKDGPYRLHVVKYNASSLIWAAFGQVMVDQLSHAAAQQLQRYGLPYGDLFRINGTQIGILERPNTAKVVTDMLAQVRESVKIDGTTLFPDVTIGSTKIYDDDDPGVAVRRAVGAADFAFDHHRPRAFYSMEHDKERRARISILADLSKSIGTADLYMVFQPKVRLADETASGAEALVRWRHPEKGVISPGRFIPVAERSPLMIDLTFDVIDKTLRQIAAWQREGLNLPVSVNISARDLSDDNFIRHLRELTDHHDVDPRLLEIEITESAAFMPGLDGPRIFKALRASGHRLAIDDYGTGQSSLSYLRSIPADFLKLDGIFVRSCATDHRDQAMVRSSISLAHDLGMEVIAEGVEDMPGIRTLSREACDYAQGYYYSKPLEADEFVRFVRNGPKPRT